MTSDRDPCAPATRLSPVPTAASAALDSFLVEFQSRYNAADAPALAELYGIDARWMAAAGPVLDGRNTVAMALRYFMTDVAPVLELKEEDRVVVGGRAVTRGTYTMHPRRADVAEPLGGAFLNVLERREEGWRILCQQMNYGFEIGPEQWVGDRRQIDMLPQSGEGVRWSALFDADSSPPSRIEVAAGGYASVGGVAALVGRLALRRAADRLGDALRDLCVHPLTTYAVGDGWAVDVGWFEIHSGAPAERWGTASLVWRARGGRFAAHWLVATVSPPTPA